MFKEPPAKQLTSKIHGKTYWVSLAQKQETETHPQQITLLQVTWRKILNALSFIQTA